MNSRFLLTIPALALFAAGCATTDDLDRLQKRTSDLQRQVGEQQHALVEQRNYLGYLTVQNAMTQAAQSRPPTIVVQSHTPAPAMPPIVFPCGGKMEAHVAQFDMGEPDGGVHVKDASFTASIPCPAPSPTKSGK